jgi:putative transcriptional regulator
MRKTQTKYGKGTILIANGNLMDPNFKRTLVLLCDHNDKGSYGLVLSRPTKTPLCEVFPDTPLLKNEKSVLYTGGPCDLNRVQILHGFDDPAIGAVKVCNGVYVGGDFEKVIRMKKENSRVGCRFYMGYSGWGPGQLDSEMEYKSWIVCRADKNIVFEADPDAMWSSILDSMGDYYSLVSKMPPNLRDN